jgi:alginate O-acetyltransferase complex protein AlgI
MVFSSVLFLFLFLPLVLAIYCLIVPLLSRRNDRLASRAGNLILLAASLIFYAWGEPALVFVMIFSIIGNYACGRIMAGGRFREGRLANPLEAGGSRTGTQKAALAAGVALNLLVLGIFKYFNFGLENVRALAALLGLDGGHWMAGVRISLPLGISFYTFQAMSYPIDVYRGRSRATRSLADFACYVTLFPQLIAGPIVRYSNIADELISRKVTREKFAYGVARFIQGLGKKVLIANVVAGAVDAIFSLGPERLGTSVAWVGVVLYAVQIYFDFSGYSDMAIGMGRMFGFTFLENFDHPYVSRSMREFWRRWHISLSTWFRDYLYIPLGGNRASALRTHLNLVIVFFLCGLWHGACWTFVIWGLMHGAFLIAERTRFGAWLERRPRAFRHGYVLLAVLATWVMFRADGISTAGEFYRAMMGMGPVVQAVPLSDLVGRPELLALMAGIIFSMPLRAAAAAWYARAQERVITLNRVGAALFSLAAESGYAAGLGAVFVGCAVSLASGSFNPFIYFRF